LQEIVVFIIIMFVRVKDDVINAAAPDGAPPRRIKTIEITIFMARV